MPSIYILVGPPASGKSTWRETYFAKLAEPTTVLSTDDMIEEYASLNNMTYSEAFPLVDFSELDKKIYANMLAAFARQDNVIVDRTNLRIKGRRKFLANTPKTYKKIAVVFDIEYPALLNRLNIRAEKTGKHIPQKVVLDMIAGYEEPTLDEFDSIVIEKQVV